MTTLANQDGRVNNKELREALIYFETTTGTLFCEVKQSFSVCKASHAKKS